jgi:hypothetical protein
MMFAKPVVGCRAGGMNEVIDEGVTGLLAEPGDVPSLVSAIGTLLDDAAKRRDFGRAGRERYLQLYTREALIERTLKFYRETLLRRSDSRRPESRGLDFRNSVQLNAERDARFEPAHAQNLITTGSAQR